MISRTIAKATLVGVAASLAVAAPAAAAAAPTLNEQKTAVIGWSQVTLSGTADAGATVQLYETAFVHDDLKAADDWEHGGGPVTAVADSSGNWSMKRWMDSGFYFQVQVGSAKSDKRKFSITELPEIESIEPTGNNSVTATIVANPGQPHLLAELQQQISGKWVKVGQAYTTEADEATNQRAGVAVIKTTGASGGKTRFRAFVNGDPTNAVLQGAGPATDEITVPGPATGGTTPPPPPGNNPPKPTPAPKPGDVQFTKINYDSPGPDSGSNNSLNTEWVKLTNKTKATINLYGWWVRDYANHVYKFTNTYNLGAGQSVFVITGKGKNAGNKRYWGRSGKGGYIWNNTSEIAYLQAPGGKYIDNCMWKSLGKGYTTC